MVLSELGSRITNALRNMSRQTVIDKDVVNNLLKEIGNALIAADVDVKLVLNLRKNIMSNIDLDQFNKRREIEKVCKKKKKYHFNFASNIYFIFQL